MHLLPCTSSPRGGGQAALPAALARLVMHNMWILETEGEIRLLEMTRFQSDFGEKKSKGLGILDSLLPRQLWLVCIWIRIQLSITGSHPSYSQHPSTRCIHSVHCSLCCYLTSCVNTELLQAFRDFSKAFPFSAF